MSATAVATLSEQQQEALMHDTAVCQLWADLQTNFYDLGEHAEEVYRKELYKLLSDDAGAPFESGDAWLMARIPEKGRSTIYRARKYFRELAIIPRDERRQIKQCNAPVMAQLSDQHKRDPKWVQRAQKLSEKEFIAKVKEELPGQHVEARSPIKLNPTESQRTVMDLAIATAQWVQKTLDGPVDREHAMEYMAAHYLASPCELEAFSHMTNQEAYESQHDSGDKVP